MRYSAFYFLDTYRSSGDSLTNDRRIIPLKAGTMLIRLSIVSKIKCLDRIAIRLGILISLRLAGKY